MKFAKYLETESIPEWRKAYIHYKGLKQRLKLVEKFRKASERRAAMELDHAFHELEVASDHDSLRRQPLLPPNAWYDNSLQRQVSFPHSLIRKLSARFRPGTELSRAPSQSASLRSSATLSVLDEVLLHASEPERMFFHALDAELEKISRFYDEKEKEARAKLEALKVQMQLIAEYGRHLVEIGPLDDDEYPGEPRRSGLFSRFHRQEQHLKVPTSTGYATAEHHISYNVARSRLKKALTEFYRSLEFLRSYKVLNETGFQKILKKFDKTAGWKSTSLYTQRIRKYHWAVSQELDDIVGETETLYINEFTDGHRRRGMRKLRVPERHDTYNATTWRTGFVLGIAIAVFCQDCLLAFDPKTVMMLPNVYTNIQIYACFLLPILFCLGFSLNLLVWHRSRINYKFIFELDPRHNLDYHQFAELPAFMLLIMSFVMFLDFSQIFPVALPSELCPMVLFFIMMAIMFCPFNIFYCSARKWLGIALGRILLSYCFRIEFRDFFIADELNSLAYSFWTFTYFACAYAFHWTDLPTQCNVTQWWVVPFLASLPPWWRLLQCLRRFRDSREQVHLINGAKYLSSILAAVITGLRRMQPYSSAMEITWLMVSLFNSCYTSTWDIKMDWGLLQPNSRHFLLRDELVFYPWTYYVAVPINVMLRFSWTLGLARFAVSGQVLGFITAFLEAIRRIQWNFFRLENEHLNNCGQYRAIKEIPLPFALETVKTMDDEEGSIHLQADPIADPIPITRQPSTRHSHGLESTFGSFYGRRDFENKHDNEEAAAEPVLSGNHVHRQPSTLNNMLTRIRSLGAGSHSDSEPEDNEDEDDEDDEDSRSN